MGLPPTLTGPASMYSQRVLTIWRSSPSKMRWLVAGIAARKKSNAYLLGVRNTYLLRHCSIGGTRMNDGSPPGTRTPLIVDGIPVVCCDAGNCPNEMGWLESTVKSPVVAKVTKSPDERLKWSLGGKRLVVTSVSFRTAR